MKRIPALFFLLTFSLAACGKPPEFPIPPGVQTVRAVLQPIPFSLKRRGTHALIGSDGKLAAYAESTAVNLRALEGREVLLQGVYEKNTDSSELPVLVVKKVLEGGEEQTRAWVISGLRLSLQLPRSWKGSLQGTSASFTESGFTMPILRITQTVPSSAASSTSAPSPGEPIVVGMRKASARIDSSNNAWVVHVDAETAGLPRTIFSFALRADVSQEQQVTLYKKLLRSIEFRFSIPPPRSSSSVPQYGGASAASSSRGSGIGAPCGGSAGILCSAGMYCRISVPGSDSGLCTSR